jgi:predicted DNA-binding ribbon-helix-helix protein
MKLGRHRKPPMKSLNMKQSVSISGHNSSVTLEGAFWNALKEIAVAQSISANALVSKIDSERGATTNLSSAIRVYVVEHYRLAANASADPQRPG